nr:hypothetical protein B0A51_05052 [Rachicladosporium sp. CCFEE 5018]
MAEPWRAIAERKRAERHSRIPKAWLIPSPPSVNGNLIGKHLDILSKSELDITQDYDATDLLSALSTRKLTSEAVTTAFCKRAAIAQQLTNCLTEILFDQAIARAKHLDAEFARTGKPIGLLHGLPISLKDTFKIKGHDASVGVAALCFKPAATNSALVELLLSLGAVLYCKTSIPQTMMALDSHNNVFGRVRNPANGALTAGGSSGGEGALVAMRGSILGVGTDVGGSIRIPALCNGLYGLKPSHGRTPYAGQEGGAPEGSSKVAIESTAGPIAHSVRDCEMFLRVIGDAKPWLFDPDCLAQNWEQQNSISRSLPGASKSVLRIGIVRTDGHVTPLPPVQRVIEDVASALRSGSSTSSTQIEVVELDLSSLLSRCLKVSNGVFSIDGANTWFDLLESKSEPLSPWLQSRLRRRPAKSIDEVVKLQAQRIALQKEALQIWRPDANGQEIHVLICPAAPHPIALVDRWNSVNYTSAFNLLDLPAGVLPVRAVTKQDLAVELNEGKALNGWDKTNREMWGEKERKEYVGSTLSVQVVAPRLQERVLVEAMGFVDEILKGLDKKASSRL